MEWLTTHLLAIGLLWLICLSWVMKENSIPTNFDCPHPQVTPGGRESQTQLICEAVDSNDFSSVHHLLIFPHPIQQVFVNDL